MKIALVYNLRHVKPSLESQQASDEAEFDTWETIVDIKKAFEKKGHRVSLIETNHDAYEKLRELKGKIDLVFNYSEGLGGLDREAQIPAILEFLGLPYTGSGPLTSAVLLDKARTKEILSFNGIATPAWKLIRPKELRRHSLGSIVGKILENHTAFPLIVKPNHEGSSKGIFNDSVVGGKKELKKAVERIFDNFRQEVLIENYLGGREFTVAMISENSRWRVLPVIEVTFKDIPKEMYPIDSYEVKWIYDSPEKGADPLVCPAKISRDLRVSIEEVCAKACRVLNILDWCRIDLRLDSRGLPNVIEINSPPGIIPNPRENSRFPRAAREAGISFPELLETILQSAASRYQT